MKQPWKILIGMVFTAMVLAGGVFTGGCEPDDFAREFQNIRDRFSPAEKSLPDPPRDNLPPEPPEDIEDHEEYRLSTLYYPEKDHQLLIPVTRKISYQEGIAKLTVEKLVDQPHLRDILKEVNLVPLLPENTEVKGVSINEGIASLNFNSAFLDYAEEDEVLVLSSLLCTLNQYPSIEKAQVMVEGSFLEEFPGGTPGSPPLGPQCRVNLEIDKEMENYQEDHTSVTVFFVYPVSCNHYFYVPVTRVMKSREDTLKASLEELLKGTGKRPGIFSNIPGDVELLSLEKNEETVRLNFSQEIMNYQGGQAGEENLLNQLALTVTSNSPAREVYVEVEGKEKEMPHGTDLTAPLAIPEVLNYIE